MTNDSFAKLAVILGFVVLLSIPGCIANNMYQERVFKEVALAKGMNGIEIACAWQNGAQNPACAVLASRGK